MFALTPCEIRSFIDVGLVHIEGAFSSQCAGEARAILLRDTGCSPDDPLTCTRPVVRLGQ